MMIDGEIEGEAPESTEVESDLSSQIESAVDKQERPEGEESPERPRERRTGRFARREESDAVGRDKAGRGAAGEEGPVKSVRGESGKDGLGKGVEADKEGLGMARPPPGYSVKTKTAWDKETVAPEEWAAAKADIAKREAEVDAGFKRYGGLGKFAEEAERNGTSLQNAVNDYVQVENSLRQDFLGGIEFLCRRMGVPLQAVISGLVQKYGGAGNGEAGAVSQGGAREAQAAQQQNYQQIDPNAIAAHAASVVRSEFEQRDINRQIEEFAADPKNKFFENVRPDMGPLVSSGKANTLKEAYEAACWLNPDIREILINEANTNKRHDSVAVATRARNAAKAVAGAPSPGSNSEGPMRGKARSIVDEIRHNLAAQEQG